MTASGLTAGGQKQITAGAKAPAVSSRKNAAANHGKIRLACFLPDIGRQAQIPDVNAVTDQVTGLGSELLPVFLATTDCRTSVVKNFACFASLC